MKLNYILIPENAIRRPRLGHSHKVSEAFSPISRAGRRAPGEAEGKTAAPPKPRAYWENITSRIEAFLKGGNKHVASQTNAAAPMRKKDLFNTESYFSKFSRKSAFHRHLLHPDQEAPVIPSRPDTFYLPSPRTPTVPIAARRVTSCTRGIRFSGSPDNGLRLNADLVPDRNMVDCVGKIKVKATSPGLSSFPLNKAGSPRSPRRSTALSNAGCPVHIFPRGTTVVDNDSFIFSPQDASILGHRLRPASSPVDKAGSSCSSRSSTPLGDMAFLPQAASILGQCLRPDSTKPPTSSFVFSPQDASILGQRLRPDASRSRSSSHPSPGGTLDRMFSSNEEKRGKRSSSRHGSPPGHGFPSGFSGAYSYPYGARSVSSYRSSRHGTPKETFTPVNDSGSAPQNTPISSEYCSPPAKKHHGDSCEYRDLSIHRQPQHFPKLHEVHINQHLPYYQSTTSPQFFDYDSRFQPPIKPFQKDSSPPRVQEYTPHEPYFDHTFHQHTPVYGWSANQYIHSQYPHQVPLNWHSQYSHAPGINHYSPLEYSPYQPYFGHY
ncbi:hypothetical protein M378DRAFT_16403 [Amanita muscaria Koide BX008]|uniref:Uncharacterized protein n=1 Tax=Amanita muscaria (strain Koide BX008) TaxID=946122 RepID=A0A0C2ST40_AMAMK|nr:hypothetical protein M378DRAFT_16402 [Amanita muscaria Koide BX008]KIL57214.1 hypothetical protein M378DRAFT_16403 [Amanita muscaria Koide BX008]